MKDLHNLFGTVREVLLNLIVCKLEDLEAVCKGCLSGTSLSKVVNNLLVGVGLLDIAVIEVDNGVAIWKHLPFNAVIEDDFLLSVFVNSLYFSVVAYYLLNNFHVGRLLAVIVRGELHVKLFLFRGCVRSHGIRLILGLELRLAVFPL